MTFASKLLLVAFRLLLKRQPSKGFNTGSCPGSFTPY